MFKRKLLVAAFCGLSLLNAAAQQSNIWYFGNRAGLNFNPSGTGIPTALTNSQMNANEGSATICDIDGNVLLYTNGETVWNKNHTVVGNGENLGGHKSSFQSAVIVRKPGSQSLYYIFTADAFENNFFNGYRYSIVDITMNGGNGNVIEKSTSLNPSGTERITAVRHANGVDAWIITNDKNSNVFRAYLLSCNGLSTNPIVSTVGSVLSVEEATNFGAIKVSPDGRQLAQTHFPNFDLIAQGNYFQLFDFDIATGVLSNARRISVPGKNYYSAEFSADSRLLYVSRQADAFLDQFECKLPTTAAVLASRVEIPAATGFYGMQLAPDGKIYIGGNRSRLSRVGSPDVKGPGCNIQVDEVYPGGVPGLNLPLCMNDNAVSSNNIRYEIVDSCNGVVQFYGMSNLPGTITWSWDFDDGTTSSAQNPLHDFADPKKVHNVVLRITSSVACDFVEKSVYISPGGVSIEVDFEYQALCESGEVKFINKSFIYPDTAIGYIWDFGDGNFSTEENPTYIYAAQGSYNVKLKLNTTDVCLADSVRKQINLEQLDITAAPNVTVNPGTPVQLIVSGGGTSFKWEPETWLNNPDIRNPVATPLDSITYYVTAIDEKGCEDTDSVTIKMVPIDDIFVPTAFTPNSDGKNDVLRPFMGVQYKIQEFAVYNRWGQMVFSTREFGKGWNGKVNGMMQSAGGYVWRITVKDREGKIVERRGTTILIR